MPWGKGIDQDTNLNGMMAAYAEQVLICTGKDDWASRIDEDNGGDNLAADLKELIGRGGVYSDVSFILGSRRELARPIPCAVVRCHGICSGLVG